MSSFRRARSASVASASSRRFFSRITRWDFSELDQRFGLEASFSTSVSCWRSLPASKVLPQSAHFFLQGGVLLFEFFDHELGLCLWVECEAHYERSNRNYRTQVGEPVAVAGVKRSYFGERVSRNQDRASLALEADGDPSIGVDGTGQTGVGVTQQPAAIFDGTHAGLIKVLRPCARIAVPAVV